MYRVVNKADAIPPAHTVPVDDLITSQCAYFRLHVGKNKLYVVGYASVTQIQVYDGNDITLNGVRMVGGERAVFGSGPHYLPAVYSNVEVA